MNPEVGILSYGVYVPRSRLQRSAIHAANAWFAPALKSLAKGERAAANWDEDSITMAVEAAREALADSDRTSVRGVTLASTTLPFADRLNAGLVKEALNLPDGVAGLDATGSQRAATSALIQAMHSGGVMPTLCIGADLRKARPASEQELSQGDAAAALVIGGGEPIARLVGARSTTIDFVDHYRASQESFDYVWENRWIRDEGYLRLAVEGLRDALTAIGVQAKDIDRAVIAIAVKGVPEAIAQRVGIRREAVEDALIGTVGDSGAAHPLLMLAAALERAQPGERIVVVAFGQGLDVLVFETTEALQGVSARRSFTRALARRRSETNYLRFLFHRGLLDLERGLRAEQDQKQPGSTLFRHRKAVLGLVGGRCTRTGQVQFPKSDISVNREDPAMFTQEDYPLAERQARIVTHTADSLAYSPDPPTYYGTIDFEGGGRLMAEFTDADESEIEVGRAVRMMFRIKAVDAARGFKRYFWKATAV